MPVGCYKQMIAMKEGVIMRLQCSSSLVGSTKNIKKTSEKEKTP